MPQGLGMGMFFLQGCQPHKAIDAPVDGPLLVHEQRALTDLNKNKEDRAHGVGKKQ